MSRYTIHESVGSRAQTETTFRGLERHHPSSGREPGRDYATIDGELEEVRHTSDGRTLIKKDFFLSREDGGRIDIPAPVSGYIHHLHDSTNAVRIYDRPFGEPGARLLAQSLHMERGTSPPQGSRIEYGQPMGRMGDTGSPGSVHAHIEAEHGQFTRYIADIAAGRIAPGVWPARGNAPAPGSPAPDGAMADGVLRQGEEGPGVRSLQQRLNQLGMRDAQGRAITVDGDFGDRTREAVERFQRSRGIAPDGIVGRDTFRELGEAVREQPQATAPRSVISGRETPPLTAADHPDRALMHQARAGVDALPAGMANSREERERLAAAIVFEAKVAGIRVDHVVPNVSGTGVFAVQGRPDDPGHQRVYVDRQQGLSQSVEQTTEALRVEEQAAQQRTAARAATTPPDAPQNLAGRVLSA